MSRDAVMDRSDGRSSLVTLAALRRLEPIRCIPGRNATKADILVYRLDERGVAVKDYGRRPWWVRHTLGRWFTRREARAYRRAEGIPALPTFLGRLGPWTLATEWLDATPLAAVEPEAVRGEHFDELRAAVDDLHRCGVALGDLNHRDVLLDARSRVRVVDLAMSRVGAPGEGGSSWLDRRWREADRVAVARLHARFTGRDPELATREVAGPAAARWHRRLRQLRRFWDRWRA